MPPNNFLCQPLYQTLQVMAEGRRSKDPKLYILDFFYDDDNRCALTARINDHRFHIIIDPAKLGDTDYDDKHVLHEYQRQLKAVRDESNDSNATYDADTVRCICGSIADDEDLTMIACDRCGIWQHNECVGVSEEELSYVCQECQVTQKKDLDVEQCELEKRTTSCHDSGVCISGGEVGAELELQNWILSFFREVFELVAPLRLDDRTTSLKDWYNVPVHFFEVEGGEDGLVPVEIKETAELRKRVDDLLPSLDMPKYIRSLPIPFVDPARVTVLAASDSIDPIHPALVLYKSEQILLQTCRSYSTKPDEARDQPPAPHPQAWAA